MILALVLIAVFLYVCLEIGAALGNAGLGLLVGIAVLVLFIWGLR